MKSRLLIVDDSLAIHDDYARVFGHSPEAAKRKELEKLERLLFGNGEKASVKSTSSEFEVDRALQGEEALTMVEKAMGEARPYSVVFMDRFMPPGWDGIRTAREVWHKAPDTQIVLVSAFADAFQVGQALFDKAKNHQLLFLRKPFDGIIIRHLATCLVEKWRQGKRLKTLLEKTVAIPLPESGDSTELSEVPFLNFLMCAENWAQPLFNAYRSEDCPQLEKAARAILEAGEKVAVNTLVVCAQRLITVAREGEMERIGEVLQLFFEQLGILKQAWVKQ